VARSENVMAVRVSRRLSVQFFSPPPNAAGSRLEKT